MLADTNAVANIAVRDLDVARRFYEGTLGMTPVDREGDDVVTYGSGDSKFLVYRSDFAGTNQATAMTWVVGDQIDAVVRELRDKGVAFEHYEMPDTTLEDDIHVCGDLRVAWFKDPDGNILNVVTG